MKHGTAMCWYKLETACTTSVALAAIIEGATGLFSVPLPLPAVKPSHGFTLGVDAYTEL